MASNNQQINESLSSILEKNAQIKIFLEYLRVNRIDYQKPLKLYKSIIILKTKTIEPEYFLIVADNLSLKKYEIEYNDLNYITNKLMIKTLNIKRGYLIFIQPKTQSIEDLLLNSKFINIKNIKINSGSRRLLEEHSNLQLKNYLIDGLPIGTLAQNNKLNELTGKEWIKFTKSWFIHNPPPRKRREKFHPAKYPESLIADFIKFFTKRRQMVLDPFIGSGSTAVAAKQLERSCIGFELNKKYYKIAYSRISQKKLTEWLDLDQGGVIYDIFNEDSNNLEKIWVDQNLPLADFCITSPPYWNQLKRNSLRQKERKESGLDTKYSDNTKDIGNIDDYKEFIKAQETIFDAVYNVLKDKAYLVIITNNVYFNGRLYPLAHDTAISLADKWVLKDEKIWCQDDKALIPLGVNSAWVANRSHQYCLIFRKEEN